MPKIKDGFRGERAIVLPSFIVEELKKDVLGKELYITDIGYYPRANFHYRERSKKEANEYILIYCVEGEGWFTLDDRKHTVYRNQFFILPEHKAHAYGSNTKNPWTIYWMHFNGEKAGFFSKGFDRPLDISPNSNSRIGERLTLFEEIYTSISRGYDKNYLLYATTSLFHFLGSMKFVGVYRESNPNTYEQKDIIDQSIHFMRENMGRKLSLAEIANSIGLSESYFANLFQKKTGYSPLRYLSHLRFQQACHYLDFTNMKVNQISPLIGFDDPFYFSRAFTKFMGMSPSEYREEKKG